LSPVRINKNNIALREMVRYQQTLVEESKRLKDTSLEEFIGFLKANSRGRYGREKARAILSTYLS
jgi:hypothetical protein